MWVTGIGKPVAGEWNCKQWKKMIEWAGNSSQRIIFLIEICKFRCINHLVSFHFPLWMVEKLLCLMKNVAATFSGLLLLLRRFFGILLFIWPNPPIVRGKGIRIFPVVESPYLKIELLRILCYHKLFVWALESSRKYNSNVIRFAITTGVEICYQNFITRYSWK